MSSLRNRSADLTTAAAVVVVGLGASALSVDQPKFAFLLVVAGMYAGLLVVRPVLTAVVAVPALYAIRDVGVGGGLGGTDVTIMIAALLALPVLAHTDELRRLTTISRGMMIYFAALLPTFVAHFTGAAGQEIVHRFLLVLAPAVVGAWLVRERLLIPALRLYLALSAVLSLFAVAFCLRHGLQPAQPLNFNKNYLGSLLSFALLLVLCAAPAVKLAGMWRLGALLLLGAGTVACQSRGAILGVALGVLIWIFTPGQVLTGRRRGRLVATVLAIGFTVFASYSVHQQLTSDEVATNSAGVRLNVEKATRDLWRTSPIVGIGIRYFKTGDYGRFAQYANNAFDNELAESGIVGTSGFVVLHSAVGIVLWRRRRSVMGGAALAVFADNFLHGQFDNYWSSGVTAMPFLLAGAVLASARESEPKGSSLRQ